MLAPAAVGKHRRRRAGRCTGSQNPHHAGIRTTTIATTNRDGTLPTQDQEVIAANGRDKVISRDGDGNGTFETIENLTVTINPDTTCTNVLMVKNGDGTLRTNTRCT